jgi:hypothetical protein
MSEPGFGDYIALNTSIILSLAHALIAAGTLDPSDIAVACRATAENMSPDDRVRTEMLAFAERWDEVEAGAERLPAPGWTPEVIPGGKDGGDG